MYVCMYVCMYVSLKNTKGKCLEAYTLPEFSRQPHKNIAAAINSVNCLPAGAYLAELKHETEPNTFRASHRH